MIFFNFFLSFIVFFTSSLCFSSERRHLDEKHDDAVSFWVLDSKNGIQEDQVVLAALSMHVITWIDGELKHVEDVDEVVKSINTMRKHPFAQRCNWKLVTFPRTKLEKTISEIVGYSR